MHPCLVFLVGTCVGMLGEGDTETDTAQILIIYLSFVERMEGVRQSYLKTWNSRHNLLQRSSHGKGGRPRGFRKEAKKNPITRSWNLFILNCPQSRSIEEGKKSCSTALVVVGASA